MDIPLRMQWHHYCRNMYIQHIQFQVAKVQQYKTSNTDTDDLPIYMALKYRSMRYVTLGVTIMMITLII